MTRRTTLPMPSTPRVLRALGANIRLARLRRRLSAELLAQRAGMSRPTLRAIEHGAPQVSLGAYANALHVLSLEHDLLRVARDDELGRKLQDAGLEVKQRAPKKKKSVR